MGVGVLDRLEHVRMEFLKSKAIQMQLLCRIYLAKKKVAMPSHTTSTAGQRAPHYPLPTPGPAAARGARAQAAYRGGEEAQGGEEARRIEEERLRVIREEEERLAEEARKAKEAEEKDRQERFRRARQLSFERKTAKKKREEVKE